MRKSYVKKKLFLYFSLFVFGYPVICTSPYAAAKNVQNTQQSLDVVEKKITKLQKTLLKAGDKKTILNREIAETDKKISRVAKSIHLTEQALKTNQNHINQLEKEIQILKNRLLKQQKRLASHLKTCYQLGEYQPLKWLLNQENPSKISRLMTYYQYIVQAQQKVIDDVKTLNAEIQQKQQIYQKKLEQQQQIKQQLLARQKKFNQAKQYDLALIETLDKNIKNHREHLQQYQYNKRQLQQVLKTLKLSRQKPFSSFSKMRHRLEKPVLLHAKKIEKLNQGLLLPAPEGESVQAVFPGKVVFSDWLKGYGLLLIIDHGQGYMTLYAHNQSLYKDVGDPVAMHEQIATVGHSGGLRKNGLYFEVRHRGKALAPLDWLTS